MFKVGKRYVLKSKILYILIRKSLAHGLLRNVMEIGTHQLRSLDIVPLVKLLVDGMSSVSRAAHRQQQNILAGSLLEGQGDGNTTSL